MAVHFPHELVKLLHRFVKPQDNLFDIHGRKVFGEIDVLPSPPRTACSFLIGLHDLPPFSRAMSCKRLQLAFASSDVFSGVIPNATEAVKAIDETTVAARGLTGQGSIKGLSLCVVGIEPYEMQSDVIAGSIWLVTG